MPKLKARSFQAGQISLHYKQWAELTYGMEILRLVCGAKIDFVNEPPTQLSYPHNSISHNHANTVKQEIKSLIQKKVIT